MKRRTIANDTAFANHDIRPDLAVFADLRRLVLQHAIHQTVSQPYWSSRRSERQTYNKDVAFEFFALCELLLVVLAQRLQMQHTVASAYANQLGKSPVQQNRTCQ